MAAARRHMRTTREAMERIIAEIRTVYPSVGIRLHPRLVTTRQRGHWRVELSWTLTHRIFIERRLNNSPERLRAFIERVIVRELDLTSQEGRTELRRLRGEPLHSPAPTDAGPPQISLWERLAEEFDDDNS